MTELVIHLTSVATIASLIKLKRKGIPLQKIEFLELIDDNSDELPYTLVRVINQGLSSSTATVKDYWEDQKYICGVFSAN